MSSEDRRVPLSATRHAGRFWRRFSSYDFARGRRLVPLALAEAEPVAASMPILFGQGEDGLEPQALLRIVPGGPSAFVSPAGLWLAAYVPSLLRVHPFSARSAGDGRMVLLVDEGSGLVTEAIGGGDGAEPFFDADGNPAKATSDLVDFFREREGSALNARRAVARLAALDLLRPFAPAKPRVPEGTWEGLLAVDRDRWAQLDDATHLELRRLGAVGLVHAHLVSMAQVAWLQQAEALRDGAQGAGQPAPPQEGPRGIDDFLAALSEARDDHGLSGAILPSGHEDGVPAVQDLPAGRAKGKPH